MTEKRHPTFLLFNGELVEYDQARVHVLSTAFKYGAIVFEGFRAYWNEHQQELYGFRLHDHFRRLLMSMKISRLPSKYGVEEYVEDLIRLMRINGLREDLHMRAAAFVDADDGNLASTEPVSISMAAMPMGRYFAKEGLHVAVSSWGRISDASMPPRVKAVPNYHNSRLALLQARVDGYDDTILLSHGGKVTEGPGYSLFIARSGRLITPPVTAGILESITRDSVIRLATEKLGLDVHEREIDRTELYVADEVFFCGSSAEVTPILSVDRHPVGDGKPGARTVELRTLFLAVTRGEVADEFGWLTPVYGGEAGYAAAAGAVAATT